MAWSKRQTKTFKGGARSTNTFGSKGLTTSYSTGSKSSRSTFTWLPNGKCKETFTVKAADGWHNRTSRTLGGSPKKSSRKTTYKVAKSDLYVILFVALALFVMAFK
jgi:hypothetical protein